MKFGIRTPSLKKSIKARTSGRVKRALKSSVNPLYGKEGMGVINNPQKAVYNKIYNKTTVSAVPKLNLNDSNSTAHINDTPIPPEIGGQFTEPIPRSKTKEERDFDIYFKLYEEARRLEKNGNADKALEIYTNILEEFEPTGTAYYERPCIILEKQKRYDEAIQICLRAIEAINNKRFNATADEFEHRLNRLLRKKEKQKKL